MTLSKPVDGVKQEADAPFLAFFNALDDGACLFERLPLRPDGLRDYRYVAMNPALQAMLGVPDLSGESVRDNFPEEVESWYDDYDRVLDTGEPIRFERESIPQGMVLEVYVARLETPRGPLLLAVVRDVSERNRTEMALKQSQEQLAYPLRLSDALRPLVDPAAVQEVAARMLGEQLGASRVFYAEFQGTDGVEHIVVEREYRADGLPSLVGRRVVDPSSPVRIMMATGKAFAVPDVEKAGMCPAMLEALRALKVRAGIGMPLIKDGKLVAGLVVHSSEVRPWSELELAFVRGTADRTWSIVERARSEATLRQRTAQLEDQAQQLRRLASELTLAEHHTREVISKTLHDHLQQLLFSAKLRLDSGGQRFRDDELVRGAQEALQEAIQATRSLSVDLFPPVLRSEGLPDALQWLADWAHRKFGATVAIDADTRADPEELDTRILLFESVRELVFNAIKHGGASRVQVDLSLEPGDRVQILVVDEGSGFDVPEAVRGHAGTPGMGLGLFSIRERMALMGGEMRMESTPGEGSCFTLLVPRRSAKPEPAQVDMGVAQELARALVADAAPRPPAGRRLRVLLADDHALVREGLKRVLADNPELECVGEAVNGLDAIEQARALHPDAVVMDVSMPVLDSVAATRQLKPEFPAMLVVGLSTMDAARPQPIERAGAAAYFNKGEGVQALVRWLLEAQAARAGGVLAQG